MITEYKRYIIRSMRPPGHETEVDEDECFFRGDDYKWSTTPQNARQFTFNQAVSKLFEIFDKYKDDNRLFHVIELRTTMKEVSVNTQVIDK